jgi:FtsZ-interacting cell division protein YlmF
METLQLFATLLGTFQLREEDDGEEGEDDDEGVEIEVEEEEHREVVQEEAHKNGNVPAKHFHKLKINTKKDKESPKHPNRNDIAMDRNGKLLQMLLSHDDLPSALASSCL